LLVVAGACRCRFMLEPFRPPSMGPDLAFTGWFILLEPDAR
jgi:hypothetical protein